MITISTTITTTIINDNNILYVLNEWKKSLKPTNYCVNCGIAYIEMINISIEALKVNTIKQETRKEKKRVIDFISKITWLVNVIG